MLEYACWGLSKNGSKNIKGFLVQSFSLEPDIKEGDMILVDLYKAPSPGDIVLCYRGEEICLIRYDNTSASDESAHTNYHIYGVVIGIYVTLA